jgi:hypothetical protein
VVLCFLHRALTKNGFHIFSAPFANRPHEEYFGRMTAQEAIARFGQSDHVRYMSIPDFSVTIGMVFKVDIESNYLGNVFGEAPLMRHNISSESWYRLDGNTIFCFRKGDILLK